MSETGGQNGSAAKQAGEAVEAAITAARLERVRVAVAAGIERARAAAALGQPRQRRWQRR